MPENISRKFIDLIRHTTGKWANWDPAHAIEVGDFGAIDKETGELGVKGNIYRDLDIFKGDANIIKLLAENPATEAPRENHFIATTSNATGANLLLGPYASIPGIAEASLKGQWTFNTKRGALLIMARPKSLYIPPQKLLEHLAKVKALEKMHLVTQVFVTSVFTLYLSSKNNDVVSVALLGSAPIPPAPGVTIGGEAGMQWWSSHTTGLFRNGQEPDGKDTYTPLYTVKKIRRRGVFIRGVPAPEGDDLWTDVSVPWDLVDEDGNEDVDEDEVFE